MADGVEVVIPGHGSVGGVEQLRAQTKQDHAYVQVLRDGAEPDDPRLGPSAPMDWLSDVHQRQVQRLAQREQNEKPE